ncbi:hypothetical protein ACFSTC_42790 [Nonomuraea ferruginea]
MILAAPIEPVHGLNAYSLAIFLHIVLFVYWLGSDIGVFYSSRFILKSDLPTPARSVAAKIMHAVDMAPRICLVLFLPSGVTLMALGPFAEDYFPWWFVVLVWVAALCWLVLVVYDYTKGATALGRIVQRLDLVVRYGLVVVLVGIGSYMMVVPEPFGVQTNPKWLGAKLAAYGLCILSRRDDPLAAEAVRAGVRQAGRRGFDAGGRSQDPHVRADVPAVRVRDLVPGAPGGLPRRRQARHHRLRLTGTRTEQNVRHGPRWPVPDVRRRVCQADSRSCPR